MAIIVDVKPAKIARIGVELKTKGAVMSKPVVMKIVEILPTKVLSFHVTDSYHPEEEVYRMAAEFAEPKGLWDDSLHHQVYGFDNPIRTDKNGTHGREVWITVPDSFTENDEVVLKDFPGGQYAMVRIKNLDFMDDAWNALINWAKNSDRFEIGEHQHLEGHINPKEVNDDEIILELYLPVKSKQ